MGKREVAALYAATDTSAKSPAYQELLDFVQQEMTRNETDLFVDLNVGDEAQAKILQMDHIQRYLAGKELPKGYSLHSLADKIYEDMAGCSFLNRWLHTPGVEEININSWDDVTVTMSGRRPQKLPEHFYSPQHAVTVLQRLLQKQGKTLNSAAPSVLSYLTDSIRIAANVYPVVSREAAVNASIRIVNPTTVTKEVLLSSGSVTQEMMDFLIACIRHKISICVAGSVGAGKTALLSCLLSYVPWDQRLISVEEGSRELQMVKRDTDGSVCNNVVSFTTVDALEISLEKLLELCLRENPDYLVVGEMRSKEAYTAAEAARTSTATYTTTHADNALDTYTRIMELSYKKYPLPVEFLMPMMVKSFPIIVYVEQYPDGSRKVSQILEGIGVDGFLPLVRSLWRYQVEENVVDESTGKICKVKGRHVREENLSKTLQNRFLSHGATKEILKSFYKGE